MYWCEELFKRLDIIAGKAEKIPGLELYAEYCRKRIKGLRPEAFRSLNKFLEEASAWELQKRREFTEWLLEELGGESQWALPYPLAEGLVKPVLLKWRGSEPSNHLPYRWLGIYFPLFENREENLSKAIQLNPEEQEARTTLGWIMIDSLWYLTHEIPWGYLGSSPEEDLLYAADAKTIANEISDSSTRTNLIEMIDYYVALIKDWIEFERSYEFDNAAEKRKSWYEKYESR